MSSLILSVRPLTWAHGAGEGIGYLGECGPLVVGAIPG